MMYNKKVYTVEVTVSMEQCTLNTVQAKPKVVGSQDKYLPPSIAFLSPPPPLLWFMEECLNQENNSESPTTHGHNNLGRDRF